MVVLFFNIKIKELQTDTPIAPRFTQILLLARESKCTFQKITTTFSKF